MSLPGLTAVTWVIWTVSRGYRMQAGGPCPRRVPQLLVNGASEGMGPLPCTMKAVDGINLCWQKASLFSIKLIIGNPSPFRIRVLYFGRGLLSEQGGEETDTMP